MRSVGATCAIDVGRTIESMCGCVLPGRRERLPSYARCDGEDTDC
jgi:hypothetical protein